MPRRVTDDRHCNRPKCHTVVGFNTKAASFQRIVYLFCFSDSAVVVNNAAGPEGGLWLDFSRLLIFGIRGVESRISLSDFLFRRLIYLCECLFSFVLMNWFWNIEEFGNTKIYNDIIEKIFRIMNLFCNVIYGMALFYDKSQIHF